jgi:hypothetical protein
LAEGENMGEEAQKIILDNIAEMRELVIENNAAIGEMRGEFREFKDHVIGRVERLEKKAGARGKHTTTIVSLLISSAALAVSVIVNFFKARGK